MALSFKANLFVSQLRFYINPFMANFTIIKLPI